MLRSVFKNLFRTGVLCALTLPLSAESPKPNGPLGPEAFDRLTVGKTITFSQNGQPYGAEEYFENRRVRWSRLDGNCVNGEWYPQGDQICFIYEHRNDPQCWSAYEERGVLLVVPDALPLTSDRVLTELKQSTNPLHCLGPDVGA